MHSPIPHPPYLIRPNVPDEVFTDRQEFLDLFHTAALKAICRRTMSTVLPGQRRMGKTELFLRTVICRVPVTIPDAAEKTGKAFRTAHLA